MSDEPISILGHLQKRRELKIRRFQFEYGKDEMSDYQITGGAIIDALMRGVSFMDIQDAFMESPSSMSFEVKLQAAQTINERWLKKTEEKQMQQDELEAIKDGMARSLLHALMNGTDMPSADLLDAIKNGVSDGIYRAAMHGAFDPVEVTE